MQVFISGTWSAAKAAPYAAEGFRVGSLLASRGYDIACGPGTGMARHVMEGYRSVGTGGKIRFYLPSRDEMERVGETIGDGADEIIETGLDYPLRNIYQIRESDALLIVTGGDGTLEEAIAALADYNLPVSGLKGSGSAVRALELLLEIFPSWKENTLISDDVAALVEHIDNHLTTRPSPRRM